MQRGRFGFALFESAKGFPRDSEGRFQVSEHALGLYDELFGFRLKERFGRSFGFEIIACDAGEIVFFALAISAVHLSLRQDAHSTTHH